ncbi:hypothetical protein HT749_21220 [Burkholderia cepacia]|uniref:hypothetical protein n=1 Tax=Burkholderia cepacia TaxID=292 RepID=UPI0011BE1B20|nr:hypothetical protein [Burkholderia cepacia]NTX45922.1 hypothetical protein [Burkholderia cepacia]
MEVADGLQHVAALQTDRHGKSGSIPWRGCRTIMLQRITRGHHVMTAGRRAACSAPHRIETKGNETIPARMSPFAAKIYNRRDASKA